MTPLEYIYAVAEAMYAAAELLNAAATFLAALNGKGITQEQLQDALRQMVSVILAQIHRELEQIQINLQMGDAHVATANVVNSLRQFARTVEANATDPTLLEEPIASEMFAEAKNRWRVVGLNADIAVNDPKAAVLPGLLGYAVTAAAEARALQALAEYYKKTGDQQRAIGRAVLIPDVVMDFGNC